MWKFTQQNQTNPNVGFPHTRKSKETQMIEMPRAHALVQVVAQVASNMKRANLSGFKKASGDVNTQH